MLYGTLENKIKKYIKNTVFVLLFLMVLYFVNISVRRFTEDNLYAETIPSNSFIQDPVLYSYFDYLSQWYYNNMYVLNSYDFTTFNSQISLQPVLSLLGQYNIISYDPNAYLAFRQKIWPLHWYTFNGFVAYTVFDLGYILALISCLIYYFVIIKLKPKKNKISLSNLFLIVLLIQIPLLAIFYSAAGGILIPLLLSIPIFIYLKISFKTNSQTNTSDSKEKNNINN
jgi:hypothetical protein